MSCSAAAIAIGAAFLAAPAMAQEDVLEETQERAAEQREIDAGEGSDESARRVILDAYGGQDVVPPDVIESGIDQERIEGVLGGGVRIEYDTGPLLIGFGGRAEVYPADARYNRYRLGPTIRTDIPLGANGRNRLRLGGGYEYVFGDDGRVFDRLRVDAQFISRHSRENTTLARLRYGSRNQSEERFTGFDQDEWLAELRHNYRPGNDGTAFNFSLLGLKHDADEDRFSYTGYGARVTGRVPLGEGLFATGRASLVRRDYEDIFSAAFPVEREDTRFILSSGLEYQFQDGLILFGDAGYTSNDSNIPVRDYDGFIGRLGVRYAFDAD